MTPTLYTDRLSTEPQNRNAFAVVKREDYDRLADAVRKYLTHSSLDGKSVRQELREKLKELVK